MIRQQVTSELSEINKFAFLVSVDNNFALTLLDKMNSFWGFKKKLKLQRKQKEVQEVRCLKYTVYSEFEDHNVRFDVSQSTEAKYGLSNKTPNKIINNVRKPRRISMTNGRLKPNLTQNNQNQIAETNTASVKITDSSMAHVGKSSAIKAKPIPPPRAPTLKITIGQNAVTIPTATEAQTITKINKQEESKILSVENKEAPGIMPRSILKLKVHSSQDLMLQQEETDTNNEINGDINLKSQNEFKVQFVDRSKLDEAEHNKSHELSKPTDVEQEKFKFTLIDNSGWESTGDFETNNDVSKVTTEHFPREDDEELQIEDKRYFDDLSLSNAELRKGSVMFGSNSYSSRAVNLFFEDSEESADESSGNIYLDNVSEVSA